MVDDSKPKVLVIEHEFVMLQGIVNYLEDNNFVVLEAKDGKTGLELFAQEKPEVVITDLMIPETSGLEVLATITKDDTDFPVIVMSSSGNVEEVIEALRLGARDYIQKPITDLAVLKHSIDNALERKHLVEENKLYAEKLKHNLEILEEDQVAGRTVQMSLLPENDYQYGDYVLKHSVTPSLYLSGDFVGHFNITETKVGFYLADVSGHGASSAFITVLLKNLIANSHARYQIHGDKTILNPEHIMEEISSEIHAAKLGKYMTMVYCVLDLETHELKYGVGGHYPNPIVVGEGEVKKYLAGSGFPVGIMSTVTYQSYTTELKPGNSMVLFSDGIMEVFMEESDMEAKDKGLLDLVSKLKAEIEPIKKAINIDESSERERPDDITMLVLRRNG